MNSIILIASMFLVLSALHSTSQTDPVFVIINELTMAQTNKYTCIGLKDLEKDGKANALEKNTIIPTKRKNSVERWWREQESKSNAGSADAFIDFKQLF